MKKVLSLVLACIMMMLAAMSLTSCATAAEKQSVEKIKEAGKLKMATEAGFAPYEFIYNNEIVGVDIEIMKATAKKLGVELDITDMDFNGIIGVIKSGKIAAGACGMTITEGRKEDVDFSIPYATTAQYLVVAADNDAIKNISNLEGKTVGVQQGTTSDLLLENLVKEKKVSLEITALATAPLAAAQIGTKSDAVLTDKLTATIIVNNSNGSLKCFEFVNADGSSMTEVESYGIAVAKGNEGLVAVVNEVINEMIDSGKLAELTQYYSDLASSIEEED